MTPLVDLLADPLANATPEDSDALYARLRETSPAHFSRTLGGIVLTRYADAREVLRNPAFVVDDPIARLERLRHRGGPELAHFRSVVATISFFMREPAHDRVRRFLSKIFQALDIAGLADPLRRRAQAQLAAGRRAGEMDLADDFGRDLALFALHRLLGLSPAECHAFARLAREVALFFDAAPRPLREIVEADAKLGELLGSFRALVRQRREAPGDDGLSLILGLAKSELDADDMQLAGIGVFFFVAGEETTATAISRGALLLVGDAALRARLAQAPGLAAKAAKELLRLTSSFQYVVRVANEDTRVAGQAVRRGQSVVVALAAANRDPNAFPNPDAIVLDRDGPEALPFGYGAYRCLGANMAAIEMQAAVEALAEAPDLQLCEPAVSEPRLRIPSLTRARARFGAA